MPWLEPKLRPRAALAGSILVGALITGWLILVPLLFAWLTVSVSRRTWPTWHKLVLLLGTWTAAVLLKWLVRNGYGLPWGGLSMYWSCLPAAVICLVVERARGQLDGVTRSDEWTYLLAIPRFFLPFLQPIGARAFVQSRQRRQTPRLALDALGLGLYGVACLLVIMHTHYAIKPPHEALSFAHHAPRVLRNAVRIYAINAAPIFCAVALLRLLGHHLGSGFRFPLLATSFSDLYRRWNYYFYEFVSSIFYLPLVSRLRRWLPLRVAYILAGYPSILLGVWALDNVTFQLAISGRNAETLVRQVTDWRDLLAHAGIWSLIILPPVAFAAFRRFRKQLWWRVGSVTLTLAAAMGMVTALFYLGVTMY